MIRLRSPVGAFIHDVSMIPLAWMLAYWVRFNLGAIPEYMLYRAFAVLPIVLIVQAGVFWYFGLYRGVWRFASLPDLVRILKAIIVGISISALIIFFIYRMEGIPRTVFPLFGLLLLVCLGGPRLLYRWVREHGWYGQQVKRVLIVGAGQSGEMLVRELLRSSMYGYRPVGFVDDDEDKHGRDIHGVRVLGATNDLPRIVDKLKADLVLLAISSAGGRDLRRIVDLCEQSDVGFRMLPRFQDLVDSRSAIKALRDVSIEDLLGRDPVNLDWQSIRQTLRDRTVLVTGGGGSIGAELCRQIAAIGPRRIVVVDSAEYNLYAIDLELNRRYPDLPIHACLVNTGDTVAINGVFERFRPEVVFHAAAYKHVPLLETHVREAVRNNVSGTRIVAEAAVAHAVGTFVLISTDKAVNPTNVMGATKRLAEMICQRVGHAAADTRFVTVRFGNVLDSAGSVVPLFRKQIAEGGPLTVTHPEVKRYFMTIPEACQLILQAGAVGTRGHVYVLDMGEPIKISYLAEQMIKLAGHSPGDDIEITYTGLRPGEKLFEELFYESENLSVTDKPKLLLAKHKPIDWERFDQGLSDLLASTDQFDAAVVLEGLRGLVPEFAEAIGGAETAKVVPIDAVKRLQ